MHITVRILRNSKTKSDTYPLVPNCFGYNEKLFISITCNLRSPNFFPIIKACAKLNELDTYSVYTEIEKLAFTAIDKKFVVCDPHHHNVVLVPPTFNANKNKVTRYTEEILDVAHANQIKKLQFTHFASLQDKFPSGEITQIFTTLLRRIKQTDCEICFDLQEKYKNKFINILAEIFPKELINEHITFVSQGKFAWKEYKSIFSNSRIQLSNPGIYIAIPTSTAFISTNNGDKRVEEKSPKVNKFNLKIGRAKNLQSRYQDYKRTFKGNVKFIPLFNTKNEHFAVEAEGLIHSEFAKFKISPSYEWLEKIELTQAIKKINSLHSNLESFL